MAQEAPPSGNTDRCVTVHEWVGRWTESECRVVRITKTRVMVKKPGGYEWGFYRKTGRRVGFSAWSTFDRLTLPYIELKDLDGLGEQK